MKVKCVMSDMPRRFSEGEVYSTKSAPSGCYTVFDNIGHDWFCREDLSVRGTRVTLVKFELISESLALGGLK